MAFIVCNLCQGKKPDCPLCHGWLAALVFDGRVFYWQKKLSRLYIYNQRLLNLTRKIIDGLIYVFILVVLAVTFYFFYQFISVGGEVWVFFTQQNMLMRIFWPAFLAGLYIFYRMSSEKVADELVIKKYIDLKLESDFESSEIWQTENLLPKINVGQAFQYQTLVLIERAYLNAENFGQTLTPVHVFYELLKDGAVDGYLARLGINASELKERLEKNLTGLEKGSGLSLSVVKIFLRAYMEAFFNNQPTVTTDELLIACASEEGLIKELLNTLEIDVDKLRNVVEWARIQNQIARHWSVLQARASQKPKHEINRSYTAVASPFLDQFSEDLTQLARAGAIEPTVGKEKELAELLSYFNAGRDGVILVGERGTGKSFVVDSLAELMAAENVPALFQDKRLVRLSVPALIAGANESGAIEFRLIAILKEVARAGNIILVIDNIEALVGLGTESSASLDLAQVLAEELEKGFFLLIAVSDREKYNQHLRDSLLGGLLAMVEVKEPDRNAAIRILETKAPLLENKYKVVFSYQALEAAVDLATQYIHRQFLPVKAITVIERAAALARQNKGAGCVVANEDVTAVVSEITKIPLEKTSVKEAGKLLNLEAEIQHKIVGQTEAVVAVAEALRRSRAELHPGKRPIASFLFLGPTGVGKTEVARVLSEIYFGGVEHFIRLDMSEYSTVDGVAMLIGFAGSTAGGYLTEQVAEKPFALLLLDEFEKATTEVHNLFLQVIEDGRLTDSGGETIDFTNTIIIATSNAGTDLIQQGLRAGHTLPAIKQELIENKLNQYFRAELLNRFDGIIIFKPLSMPEVLAITKLLLNNLTELLATQGIALLYKETAVQEISQAGFDQTLGARPLRRVIQDQVENKIANLILAKTVARRDKIILNSLTDIQVEKAPPILG
ncbi:MAG TPA: ATP-dependent Clp protease ATP-binding subunit [bacterium]|nr:ATP-dependent Clp protease ATP-binding subunit [bacterium]